MYATGWLRHIPAARNSKALLRRRSRSYTTGFYDDPDAHNYHKHHTHRTHTLIIIGSTVMIVACAFVIGWRVYQYWLPQTARATPSSTEESQYFPQLYENQATQVEEPIATF